VAAKRKPPTIKDAKVQRLLNALSYGHYMRRACKLAKIAEPTAYLWMSKGKEERSRLLEGHDPDPRGQAYLEILEAIEAAQEQAAHIHMMTVYEASKAGNVQAATWYLSRTDREHYGQQTVISGPNNGPIQMEINREDLSRRLIEWLKEMEADEDSGSDPSES